MISLSLSLSLSHFYSSKQMQTGEITSIIWSKNDRFIATGSSNGSITVLTTINNQISKPLYFSNKNVRDCYLILIIFLFFLINRQPLSLQYIIHYLMQLI